MKRLAILGLGLAVMIGTATPAVSSDRLVMFEYIRNTS